MEHVERLCAVPSEETALCDALVRVLRDEQPAVVRLRPEAIVSCLAATGRVNDTGLASLLRI